MCLTQNTTRKDLISEDTHIFCNSLYDDAKSPRPSKLSSYIQVKGTYYSEVIENVDEKLLSFESHSNNSASNINSSFNFSSYGCDGISKSDSINIIPDMTPENFSLSPPLSENLPDILASKMLHSQAIDIDTSENVLPCCLIPAVSDYSHPDPGYLQSSIETDFAHLKVSQIFDENRISDFKGLDLNSEILRSSPHKEDRMYHHFFSPELKFSPFDLIKSLNTISSLNSDNIGKLFSDTDVIHSKIR